MIRRLAFEKKPFQFCREIWIWVVVILLQLYSKHFAEKSTSMLKRWQMYSLISQQNKGYPKRSRCIGLFLADRIEFPAFNRSIGLNFVSWHVNKIYEIILHNRYLSVYNKWHDPIKGLLSSLQDIRKSPRARFGHLKSCIRHLMITQVTKGAMLPTIKSRCLISIWWFGCQTTNVF